MAYHLYDIVEVYSNADGTQQFIELRTTASGQNFLQGHQIRYTNGVTTNTFTFDHNLSTSKSTANTTVLIGTEGWAELGLVTPDYVVENNFLVTTGGTINFGLGQDTLVFSILPDSDNLSQNRAGAETLYSPANFAGDSVMYGTEGNNKNMSGGAGKDNMFGLGGNDTINGGVGHDTLDGGMGNDKLIGSDGNDSLVGGDGADNLNGGNGSDTLVWDELDTKVDGGAGNADKLLLTAGDLDLTTLVNGKILNIERIDMVDGNVNTLTVNKREVLDISSNSNTLTVVGDVGDTVTFTDTGWVEKDGPDGFVTYANGAATIRIYVDVTPYFPPE